MLPEEEQTPPEETTDVRRIECCSGEEPPEEASDEVSDEASDEVRACRAAHEAPVAPA
jgi:hypothetical protein